MEFRKRYFFIFTSLSQIIFSINEDEKYIKLRDMVMNYQDSFNSPWKLLFLFIPSLQKDIGYWSLWGNFLRKQEILNNFLINEISQRDSNSKKNDILNMMIFAKDENHQSLSKEELRDELLAFLITGNETVSASITYVLYWIRRVR